MNKPMIALLLSLTLPAAAAERKVVSENVKINAGERIQVEMDKGELSVTPSAAGAMTYTVEFVPERKRWFFGSAVPTAQDLQVSTASFDAAKGVLTIRTGKRLKAIVKLEVPAKQELDVRLQVGTADIGPVSGKLEAFVDVGVLTYDASAMAAGVCVEASMGLGEVKNERDQNCKSVGAELRGRMGTISVN